MFKGIVERLANSQIWGRYNRHSRQTRTSELFLKDISSYADNLGCQGYAGIQSFL